MLFNPRALQKACSRSASSQTNLARRPIYSSQRAQHSRPPDPISIYKTSGGKAQRIYRRARHKIARIMDDLEADQVSLLEGLDALSLSQDSDIVCGPVSSDDSTAAKVKRCEVIHNLATEVNLLARAVPKDQSTTVLARPRKGFLDLPGGLYFLHVRRAEETADNLSEIRNLIYGQICDRCDHGELAIRKQRTGYQEIAIIDNEGSRPLAIFGVNRQVRHEFLTFWLRSHPGTTTAISSEIENREFSILITAHMTFSSLIKLQVTAIYRPFNHNGGARISLMFGSWKFSELTPSSKDRIAMSIAEIFQTNDDISLDKFLLAADKILGLSLEVIVHPYEHSFGPRFHTTFSVEKTSDGELPAFFTEG